MLNRCFGYIEFIQVCLHAQIREVPYSCPIEVEINEALKLDNNMDFFNFFAIREAQVP